MAASKKPNIFVRMLTGIVRFFKEFKSDVKKISWPSRKQVINNSVVVIVMVLLLGAVIWILDFVFASGLRLIVNILG